MGLRQKEWAAKASAQLRHALGCVCAKCGKKPTRRSPLEFDCIEPRGPEHHKMEWSHRVSFYRAQHQQANLQLLCKPCHGAKTASERNYVPF